MRTADFIEHCLLKKGAYSDYPFGEYRVVVKVKKRIFAQFFILKGTERAIFNYDAMTGYFYRGL